MGSGRRAFLKPETREATYAVAGVWAVGYAIDALVRLSEGRAPPAAYLLMLGVHSLLAMLALPAVRWAESRPGAPRRSALVLFTIALAWVQGSTEHAASFVLGYRHDYERVMYSQPFFISLYATALGVLLLVFLSTRRRAEAQSRRLAAAELETRRAQLAALRLQLNPHFLFNTLNTVSGLMTTGRVAEAEAMNDRLARFLRIALETDSGADVTVEEEFASAEAYLEIEAVRLGDRLALEIDCEPAARRALLPSLLLQPLVENAIKYGVAPAEGAARLRLTARRDGGALVLRVEDVAEGPRGSAPPSGTGLGLDNVRRRLEALYGPDARLEAGPTGEGWAAEARLPFVVPRAAEAA